ncbi:hypothetical protein [Teredinibacter turnerae]|uniref:hypothetical protein n=1 Tax=Teredinibacter turnerae TaxID=2426 RepID=UPI00048D1332|nr:hypothetical protein [Teredinibacter turnerae]
MDDIEILKHFDQNAFDSESSEEEIVLLRSKWEQWGSHKDFVARCAEWAWGDLIDEKISLQECTQIYKQKSCLVKGLEFAIPKHATGCRKLCDDWNCKSVMWKEKSYYYLFGWSTTA